ncbi:MAG: hypothetical protein ABEJ05_11905 [Haloglomus sp.]
MAASLLAASRRADGGEITRHIDAAIDALIDAAIDALIDAAIDALIDLAVRNRDREAPAAACRRRVSASL